MNNIPALQLEKKNLERLAAMRELYSAAKKWYGWQIAVTVLIPVVLAILSLIYNDLSIVSAVFGVAFFFIDAYFIDGNIKRRKERAAKIQELFDCELLEIPFSPLKISNDVTVEEVLIHYSAHAKIPANIEKIHSWYDGPLGHLPIYIDRIVCQRSNIRWDNALRKRYANIMKYVGSIVLITVLLASIITNIKINDVMLILSGLVPFFQFCIKQHNDNQDSVKRLDELLLFVADLWTKATVDCADEDVLTLESRRLQDEIFTHRSNNPLVLDCVYNKFRNIDEKTMVEINTRLIEEALASPCLRLKLQNNK